MTREEQMVKMTTAIKQALKVMGDRFGSTEQDVGRAIQGLKVSIQVSSEPGPSMNTLTESGGQSLQDQEVTART
jgi:hypothetical protein